MKKDDYFIKKKTNFVCDPSTSYFNQENYPLPKRPKDKDLLLFGKED